MNGDSASPPPTEPVAEIKKPAFVKSRAARIWKKYCAELQKKGSLKPEDADMFGVWCCLMAEFQKDPDRFITAKLTQMRLLAETFEIAGRSSRERVKPSKPSAADPAERYFA